jgi:hypothetical protein
MKVIHCLAACVLAFASQALAELPTGEKKITLSSATEKREIGTVTFSNAGPNRKISVNLHEGLFKDHFLSMRPFKCMEGATRYYCHLPYPYEWKGEISPVDLASPPAKGNFRPLTEDMLTPAANDGQWLPYLTIE